MVHSERDKSDSSLVPDLSPQTSSPSNSPLSWEPHERPEGRRGGACLATVRVSTWGEHTPQLLQAYITFTNTYINTSHTTVGLGGRLPIEAQLSQLGLRILGKGIGLPEMCSVCSLLPKSPPSFFSGSSLSSMESCHRWVWRLETWAAGSWAGCADQSHSGYPAVGGGAAAGSGAAGGLA